MLWWRSAMNRLKICHWIRNGTVITGLPPSPQTTAISWRKGNKIWSNMSDPKIWLCTGTEFPNYLVASFNKPVGYILRMSPLPTIHRHISQNWNLSETHLWTSELFVYVLWMYTWHLWRHWAWLYWGCLRYRDLIDLLIDAPIWGTKLHAICSVTVTLCVCFEVPAFFKLSCL